jgi:NADH-quinone oxidoreductase subunit N
MQVPINLNEFNLDYQAILPEAIAAVAGVVCMLADALAGKNARKVCSAVALIGLVLSLLVVLSLWGSASEPAFAGMIVTDNLRLSFSIITVLASIVAVLMAMQFVKDEGLPQGEFFTLILFATAGGLLLCAANDLVTVFLGLEIASITTYVLAGYRRSDARANESSLKYFLLGAFSTAFLLYGMALVYGATGKTNIGQIQQVIASGTLTFDGAQGVLLVGAAMMLVGFGFKIASAPFHLWTPDVYEGAPSLVTGFMATGPKAAVFAAFWRVFAIGFSAPGMGIGGKLHTTWVTVLAVIAVLTMTIGNVIAISQTNIKRLLAYSSIAHAGYALVGFLTQEFAPVAFYMLTYTLMNLGAFAVIQMFARPGDEKVEINDYAGVGFESPGLSFALVVFLLSMAGIPPTAGFIGKFFVFKSAWDTATVTASPMLKWLVVAAVLNSIVSVYYYIYPIVVMYFRPLAPGYRKPRVSAAVAAVLALTLLGTFYLGILPNRVLNAFSAPVKAVQQAALK